MNDIQAMIIFITFDHSFFKCIVNVVPKFSHTLVDIIYCSMTILFLVEYFRVDGIYHQFEGTYIQDSVVKELIQSFHVMEHE